MQRLRGEKRGIVFAGHVGIGLSLGRAERRINVGWFVTGALALDFLLWLFVLGGWESVDIPSDFGATHQSRFVFPYSHGLIAAVVWSVIAGALAFALLRSRDAPARWRVAVLVGAAVASHWVLDALVHRPEMPLLGSGSGGVGLALWNRMPLALSVEGLIAAAGTFLFLSGGGLARGRAIGLGALSALVIVFTVIGMTVAPAPSSASAMAVSSLITLGVVAALFAWLGTRGALRSAPDRTHTEAP